MQSRQRKKKIAVYYCLVLMGIFLGYLVSPVRIYFPGISAQVISSMTLSVVVFLGGVIVALVTFLFSDVIVGLGWISGGVSIFIKWLFRLIGIVTVIISLYFAIMGFAFSTASPKTVVEEAVTDSSGFSYIIYKIPGGAMSSSSYEVRKERSIGPGIKYSKVLCRSENYPGVYAQNGKVRVPCD